MPKAHTALDEMAADGEFKRTAAAFLGGQIAPGTKYEPAAGRYHLYVSLACPWAAGTLTTLFVKGLEHAISYSIAHPTWKRTKPDDPEDKHYGWHFKSPGDAPVSNDLGHGEFDCDDWCVPCPYGFKTMRDVYEAGKDTSGKYSTPVLWDSKTKSIVSNESIDIIRIFNSSFQEFAKNSQIDLFPTGEVNADLEALNTEFIYNGINNGVYRCGFATKQKPYEEAFKTLFDALETVEDRLSTRRFLGGTAEPTWLDLRLFHTIVRFDPVYVVYFKTNAKFIAQFPNLLGFMRDVYQWSEVRRSVNIRHIKMHYFTSHTTLNTYGIIPLNNGPDLLVEPGRAQLGKGVGIKRHASVLGEQEDR